MLLSDIVYGKVSIYFWLMLSSVSAYPASRIEGDFPSRWPLKGVVLEGRVTEGDIKRLSEQGFNSVQIFLNIRRSAQKLGVSSSKALEDNLTYVDEVLDACKKFGLTSVISLSHFPIDPKFGLNQDSPEFWASDRHLQDVVDVADKISRRYASRGGELTAYEFLSEPLVRHAGKVSTPPQWQSLSLRLVRALRQNDPDRFVSITAGLGGSPSEYGRFHPIPEPRIIYSAHMYLPHAFTHQGIGEYLKQYEYPGWIGLTYWNQRMIRSSLAELHNFQIKYKVPVMIGEFSAHRKAKGGDQYIQDLISLFNSYGWAWTYYSYKGFQAWNPSILDETDQDDPKLNAANERWDEFSTRRWKLLKNMAQRVDVLGK